MRYRNSNARHTYEKETKKEVTNLVKKDEFVKHEKGLSNAIMTGANDNKIEGDTIKVKNSFLQKEINNAMASIQKPTNKQ
jgi:hypothetical protein